MGTTNSRVFDSEEMHVSLKLNFLLKLNTKVVAKKVAFPLETTGGGVAHVRTGSRAKNSQRFLITNMLLMFVRKHSPSTSTRWDLTVLVSQYTQNRTQQRVSSSENEGRSFEPEYV